MQFKRLAIAVLAAAPLLAAAQSNVTIYGVLDAALSKEDTGAPNGKKTLQLNSGSQSSSRFGFRGSEDLGGGLKAIYNLEAGYALDTGVGDSALFGRRSVVGLESAYGTVTLGREYSPIAAVAAASDPFGQGFYGSNLSAFGSTGRLTRRLSNSVNYKSPAYSGFSVLAAYSAGEQVSPTVPVTADSLNLRGIAGQYANGGLYLGLGYHEYSRLAIGNDKEMAFGAAYKFGDFEVKGGYLVADPTGANNKFQQYNLGGSYTMAANKFFVTYQQNKVEAGGAKGNAVAVAYTYNLSKRTNLYASYAKMDNNNTALFALNSSSTNVTPPGTAPGSDPSAFTVGLRHAF
ncbi:porin [Massilia sp. DWR3-1-1]|uniref:porin n=1 Tax=Massilia sp. DWR3-1-1 TaxID=2804559 RepID=UPI003CF86DC0